MVWPRRQRLSAPARHLAGGASAGANLDTLRAMQPGTAPDLDTISNDLAAVEEALAKLDAGTYFGDQDAAPSAPSGEPPTSPFAAT